MTRTLMIPLACLALAACTPAVDALQTPDDPPTDTKNMTDEKTLAVNEMRETSKSRPVSTEAWQNYTPWDSTRADIQKTGTGLEYIIIETGPEDGTSPQGGDVVAVYYEGRFDTGGDVFDSAFQRGEPALFPANQLIPGWVEVLSLMKPGDRWLIHLPPALAYGAVGSPPVIPPDAALNFEIELIDVVPDQS